MMRRFGATANAAKKAPKRRFRLSPETREKIATVAILSARYYRDNGRDFPWRHERDGFRLAVAEILLQKTRAESVVPVYARIIATYPNAIALACADPGEIEELLCPLGLSQKRSIQLVGMAGGATRLGPNVFGDWHKMLEHLPGIGAYGARAIACFGRGQKIGIVDANVARILRRVFRIANDDTRAPIYQRYADAIGVAGPDARATNFGLLDIGAGVCTPVPHCGSCPLEPQCPRFGTRALARLRHSRF